MKRQKMAVVGAGAWGTAMASLQAENGHIVTIWAYEEETADGINKNHRNTIFLPDIPLSPQLFATQDLSELVKQHQTLLMATPSHVTQAIVQQVASQITAEHCFVILTKGIEPQTLSLMSEVYQAVLPTSPTLAILSGPNFAKEVAQGKPTAAVLACADPKIGKRLQQLLSAPTYRIYLTTDLIGVQIGGTIKNVLAIAAGICDGMQLGANARAALICRGMAEMKRLGEVLGGKGETFLGLSGVGDLILTATDPLSRNYSLGFALGKGSPLSTYLSQKKSVAEGVKNATSLHELALKHQTQMPICEAVYAILYCDLNCQEAFHQLLNRELPERE